MQTRKYPRTLEQAFGPYTSRDFNDTEPMHPSDKIVLVASAIGAVVLIAMIAVGWVK
jgi:hypothetical protein